MGIGTRRLVWRRRLLRRCLERQGYRLHRLRYTETQLEGWADHLRAAQVRPAFCYFTHETGPEAVGYALRLMDLMRA